MTSSYQEIYDVDGRLLVSEACGNLVGRRRQAAQVALEHLEKAARWWEALQRLGASVNTEAPSAKSEIYSIFYIL